ncbi:MAG: HAD hydrolase-like protein [Candidatus Peregrinibacteria bacterium]|nr:HAD hydrolase-like protein [Candidatus Peregrinibacteria bacterium]
MEFNDEKQIVLWDGDNTVWDWMEYAVPAYEAMCEEIARIAGKDTDTTAAAMKAFYAATGTMENVGLIQGLNATGFFNHVKDFDQTTVITQVHSVFNQVREANLHVYPGIQKVMEELRQEGYIQHILTDAPAGQALSRLSHSRLSANIDTVFAMPDPKVEGIPSSLIESHKKKTSNTKVRIVSHEKPHTNLEDVLELTHKQIKRLVTMIGDNKSKDMELAERYGMRGIHAVYGKSSDEQRRRIERFAPLPVLNRNMQAKIVSKTPDENSRIKIAFKPEEIKEILKNAA